MKIPFRTKILLLYYKYVYKKSYDYPLVKIGESGKGVESILFFLPSEIFFAQVISHFIKRNNNNIDLKFKYLLYENSLIHYQYIPKSHTIILTDDDINWFGGIKNKMLIDGLANERFDALVDLNQSHDQSLSLLSLQLKIPIKVGFQSPISDDLFSIVVKPEEGNFLETNYQLIEKILGIS
ncbi:MAG: DUF6913 domain-containing protein [Candidatus Neomarinimicrobiota bacterium]